MDFFKFGLELKLDHYSCVEFHGVSDYNGFKALKPIIGPLIGPNLINLNDTKNGVFHVWTRTKVRPTFLCKISWQIR